MQKFSRYVPQYKYVNVMCFLSLVKYLNVFPPPPASAVGVGTTTSGRRAFRRHHTGLVHFKLKGSALSLWFNVVDFVPLRKCECAR